MTDASLSRLYRSAAARVPSADAAMLDAATLTELSAGRWSGRRDELADVLSRSPAHGAILRMLRELESDSAALASRVNTLLRPAHERGRAGWRPAAGARRLGRGLRWAGLAACLMVASVVGLRHLPIGGGAQPTPMMQAQLPDRIFTAKDRIFSYHDAPQATGEANADGLFRSDFNGG